MPPAWQDAERPLRAPHAHRNLEAVRRLPRNFRGSASIYDPASRCSTMRSRHQNSRRALPRRRRPQEFRGHRRPRGLGPLPYSGDNCPRLHGVKRENHSFDSRFILGLQNSPFSPWGGRLVWFAFSFVEASSRLGGELRHASTSATTSSSAAATSSGLAVYGRRLRKMTGGVLPVASDRDRVRKAKRTGCVSY
jgi:hypothetical protein